MKKYSILHSLTRTTIAAIALLTFASAHASTSWVSGGNWADDGDNFQDGVIYPTGITSSTTTTQAAAEADLIAADDQSVGINFVRIGINPATISGNWSVVQAYVNELISDGMTVDLACWDGSDKDGIINSLSAWQSMWQTVDGVYKNNNAVYYEPFNEPHGYTLSGLESVYSTFLGFINKSQNHIILDGTGFAANVTGIGGDSAFNGCLLGLHIYQGWGGCVTEGDYESYLPTVIGSYASRTVMTEMGAPATTGLNYGKSSTNVFVSYIRGVCTEISNLGIGMAYWPSHRGGDTYRLFSSPGDGTINNYSLISKLESAWDVGNANTRSDFFGGGVDDFAFFRPSNGTWNISSGSSGPTNGFQFGTSGDVPLADGDWDGDGLADAVLFRPSNGTWYVRFSSDSSVHSFQFGTNGDIPLLGGDFDGDGCPDAVLFRPSTGTWYVRFSSTQGVHSFQFGTNGDIPLLNGDFDGDGSPDAVVFRPSNGTWYVRFSSTQGIHSFQFGTNGDIPVLGGDYDGDGSPDAQLFRPSTGTWYARFSGDQSVHSFQYGTNGDIPWTAYMTLDHKVDQMLYRPSTGTFYVRDSVGGVFTPYASTGTSTDIPVH